MSKKACVVCDGNGKWPRDIGPPCDACGGTGVEINDGALDADRTPMPLTDVDDDAAREWLARYDGYAQVALAGVMRRAPDNLPGEEIVKLASKIAWGMLVAVGGLE